MYKYEATSYVTKKKHKKEYSQSTLSKKALSLPYRQKPQKNIPGKQI